MPTKRIKRKRTRRQRGGVLSEETKTLIRKNFDTVPTFRELTDYMERAGITLRQRQEVIEYIFELFNVRMLTPPPRPTLDNIYV